MVASMQPKWISLLLASLLLVCGGCAHTRYETLDVDSYDEFESPFPEYSFELSDRMEINYVRTGEGYPIIFLHGLGGDHEQWNPNIEYFAEDFSVYALDFPGHGKSSRPDTHPYSIANHTEALLELMAVEEIDEAVLVGNSMGGHVALRAAVNHPDRVRRLVLVSPSGGVEYGWVDHVRMDALALNPAMESLDEQYARYQMSMIFERNRNHPVVEEYVRKQLLTYRDPERLESYERMVSRLATDMTESDLYRDVPGITQNTLIVWGENDQLIDVSYGHELNKRLPNSYLKLYPGTGHVASLERPDQFNELVAFFLRDLAE